MARNSMWMKAAVITAGISTLTLWSAASATEFPLGTATVEGHAGNILGVSIVDNSQFTHDLSATVTFSHPAASMSFAAVPAGTPSVSAAVASTYPVPYEAGTAASGLATLSYWMYVTGPEADDLTVPIFFAANLRASAKGPAYTGIEAAYGGASLSLQEYSTDEFMTLSFVRQIFQAHLEAQYRGDDLNPSSSVTYNDVFFVSPGRFVATGIAASVAAQFGGSAFAYADPYFYIDPNFLADHPGYALEFSPYVGNDPIGVRGVPEPTTWVMMLLGSAIVGMALRRRYGFTELTC